MNAIMPKFDIDATEQQRPQRWEGLSEIDQAIRDNRLMEYRIWSEPEVSTSYE